MFFNAKTAPRLVVHGDDFIYSRTKKELEKIKEKMRECFDIKDRGTMGSEKNEIKEVKDLGADGEMDGGGVGVRGGCWSQAEDHGSGRTGGGLKDGAQPFGEGRQRQGGMGREGLRYGRPPKISK